MPARYEVTVGNLGTIYRGDDSKLAEQRFEHYRKDSIMRYGRVAGEPVTLFRDDEIIAHYPGTLTED